MSSLRRINVTWQQQDPKLPNTSFPSVQIMPPLVVDRMNQLERIDIRNPFQPEKFFLQAVIRWILGRDF